MTHTACPLCNTPPGTLLWQDQDCFVILTDEPDYPALCRIIWRAHVKEMSDLTAAQQCHLLHVVMQVERVLRQLLNPDKINLASLGNVVPHVHWHVIPRFHNDRHYPNPIWGAACREPADSLAARVSVDALRQALTSALANHP